MNLAQFIDETLTEVIAGVRSAQAKEHGGNVAAALSAMSPTSNLVNSSFGIFTIVDFDVSVVAETKADGKAGVRVWTIGADAGLAHSTAQNSRVKFSVPVRIPDGIRVAETKLSGDRKRQ